MTPAEFAERVDELLDERRDPLADEACIEFLAADPARLEEYVVLQERLAALPKPAREPRRAAPRIALATAVVAAAVLVVLVIWRSAGEPAVVPGGRGAVLAASSAPVSWNPGAATPAHARAVLLASPHARLEVYQQW